MQYIRVSQADYQEIPPKIKIIYVHYLRQMSRLLLLHIYAIPLEGS
jgi:hypothetical protein